MATETRPPAEMQVQEGTCGQQLEEEGAPGSGLGVVRRTWMQVSSIL